MPIAGVTLEILFDKRRLIGWFSIGLALVLSGGIIAIGSDIVKVGFGFGILTGILAVAFFAWGSRATVKRLPKLSALGQTAVTSFGMWVFCSLIFLFCSFFEATLTEIPTINMKSIVLLLIYSWLGMGISQLLWIKGVNRLGIGIASFHLNAAPLYVMSVLFLLGEKWNWIQAIGSLIVIVGILLSQKKHPSLVQR